MKMKQFYTGILLSALTAILVMYLGSSRAITGNESTRYVGAFVAGLFGFTAIDTLRRSLN
jgi:hypothetical protein